MVRLTLTLRVQDSTRDGCSLHVPTTPHRLRLDPSARGAAPRLRGPVSLRAAFLYLTSDCGWRSKFWYGVMKLRPQNDSSFKVFHESQESVALGLPLIVWPRRRFRM